MPKPIFNTRNQQNSITYIDLNNKKSINNSSSNKIEPETINKMLRNKRNSKYMEAIKQFDLCGHQMDRSKLNELIEIVRNEFPEVPFEDQLLGIVAKCYLGDSYEVHTLDIMGEIVTHYKTTDSLPNLTEKARGLALYGGYEFIEVYTLQLRAIGCDGSVCVI